MSSRGRNPFLLLILAAFLVMNVVGTGLTLRACPQFSISREALLGEEMREAYDQRRRFLVKALRDMGLDCYEPQGAFYVFPCIKKFGMSSDTFALRLLEQEKVAVVPGTAFGDCGEGYLRISYAYSLQDLKRALERMGRFVASLEEM